MSLFALFVVPLVVSVRLSASSDCSGQYPAAPAPEYTYEYIYPPGNTANSNAQAYATAYASGQRSPSYSRDWSINQAPASGAGTGSGAYASAYSSSGARQVQYRSPLASEYIYAYPPQNSPSYSRDWSVNQAAVPYSSASALDTPSEATDNRGAYYNRCPSRCRPTCAVPNPPNCQSNTNCNYCGSGYILSQKGGVCIKVQECPYHLGCNGDDNAIVKECPLPCPSTCAAPNAFPCKVKCLPLGCECKEGYILSAYGKCIEPRECPGGNPCRKNEIFASCKVPCPRDYCPTEDILRYVQCETPEPCYSGCICRHNYKRLSREDDRCIYAETCPPVTCVRPNQQWNTCPAFCPGDYCQDLERPCSPPFIRTCNPRCTCIDGYIRNNTDICIPKTECGCKGDRNATLTKCPTPCPATCKNPDAPNGPCTKNCLVEGCQCNKGYVLSDDNKCILLKDCPGCNGDRNATLKEFPTPCPATCQNPDAPNKPCARMGLTIGCECNKGYLRSDDNKCILPKDCAECRGDKNATYSECPSACPATCKNPDAPNGPCTENCLPAGCTCKKGYVLSDDNKCILPKDCAECRGDKNATYSECPSACPATCKNPDAPNGPCTKNCLPAGCTCKKGYVLSDDNKCILPTDCPGCKGDRNATLTSCPNPCPSTCDNLDTSNRVCTRLCVREGCQCNEGYVLSNGTCILPQDCPGYEPCPDRCRPTCAVPNPKNCDYNPRCLCQKGYILDKECGKCIKIDQCPNDQGCNCDKNAVIREHPPPCPSTCEAPDETPCKKAVMAVGCVCKSGYIRKDAGGDCIKPDKCPGGNPCGVNGTFVDCKVDCPSNYCPQNDDRGIIICDPIFPCPSGCVCKRKYRRKSPKDPQCILAEECPPVKCTRENEKWNKCPPPCFAEGCDDVKNPPSTCNTLIEPECYPQCVCKKGCARDNNDKCISVDDCPC